MDFVKSFKSLTSERIIYYAFVVFLAIGAFAFVTKGVWLIFLLAGILLFAAFVFPDYRRVFYLIFATLPFSIEYFFEGPGLGTDFPSEPLMILLSGIGLLVFIKRKFAFDRTYVQNPVFILLTLHLFWIFLTAINSTHLLLSFKYFAAKIWYLIPFFYLPLVFIEKRQDIEKAYKILYVLLFISICIVLLRHAMEGFSFISSYHVVRPFYRNHVAYAAISVICLPFVWMFMNYKVIKSERTQMMIILIIFITGIYFSYTRAAILSIFIAIGAYYIIRYKWMKSSLTAGILVTFFGVIFMSWNNRYLDYAPDYERTISHHHFDNLIEATYKLEDISSMERVYRWMAGVEMIREKPWLGFGPSTFYSEYKAYSISRFQTYVSDNPENSGIHNYFLMIFVEQGLIGFLIFLALCCFLLIQGESVFHRLTDQKDKWMAMAATLSIIIILSMSLINDLIETDKVGPFFFFNAAIILFLNKKANFDLNSGQSNVV